MSYKTLRSCLPDKSFSVNPGGVKQYHTGCFESGGFVSNICFDVPAISRYSPELGRLYLLLIYKKFLAFIYSRLDYATHCTRLPASAPDRVHD